MTRSTFKPVRMVLFPALELRRWWLRKLTPTCNVAILVVIASLNAVWGFPLLGLLVSTILLLIVAGVTNWWFRPRLQVALRMPNVIACDASAEGTIWLENIGSMPVYDLWVAIDESQRGFKVSKPLDRAESIEIGEQVIAKFSFVATERGEFRLPSMEYYSTFPFNLFRAPQIVRQSMSFMVTPRLRPIDPMLVSELAHVAGITNGGLRMGESFEYAGSRQWVAGDSPRAWDHAAWARLGRPIVREYQQLTSGSIVLFVDTLMHVPTSMAESAEFERRLSLAASIIDALRWTPCQIGLVMIQGQQIIDTYSTHDHPELLLVQLAQARPEPIPSNSTRASVIELHRILPQQIDQQLGQAGSSMVIITSGTDQARPDWIQALMKHSTLPPIFFSAGDDE